MKRIKTILLALGCIAAVSLTSCLSDNDSNNDQEGLTKAEVDQCFAIMRGTYNGKVLFAAKNPDNPLDQIDTLDISWTVADTTLVVKQLPPAIIKDKINDKKIQEAFAEAQPSQMKAYIGIFQKTPIGFLLAPLTVDYNIFYDESTHKASLVFWYNNYSYGYYNTTSNLFEMQLVAAALYIDDNQNYNYIASGGETTANYNFILTTADLTKVNETSPQD